MVWSGIPPAVRAGHNRCITAKAGHGAGSFGSLRFLLPLFPSIHKIFASGTGKKPYIVKFPLETPEQMGYNTGVYARYAPTARAIP
jgi:hypothetical protein